jgi:purine-nucleoside phosphorylase
MSLTLTGRIDVAANYMRKKLDCDWKQATLVVLGSGFKAFAESIIPRGSVEFADVPGFSAPKVHGHGSSLVVAESNGKPILLATGRVHLYEGYTAHDIVLPIRAAAKLGVKSVVLTNASGSVNPSVKPGTILDIHDHINFTGKNCLIGANELGAQFVDMVNAYDSDWRKRVNAQHQLTAGIYCGLVGPTYETPAETAAFGRIGADVVGMSTVQETIAARQLGMKVLGLSLVTNFAGGLAASVNHEEVLLEGKTRGAELTKILNVAIATRP